MAVDLFLRQSGGGREEVGQILRPGIARVAEQEFRVSLVARDPELLSWADEIDSAAFPDPATAVRLEAAVVVSAALGVASAAVLSAFFSLFFRSFLLLLLDRGRGAIVVTTRVLAGWIFLTLGWLYALFVADTLFWNATTIGVVVLTAVLVHAGFAFRQITRRKAEAPGLIALLVHTVFLLALLFFLSWNWWRHRMRRRPWPSSTGTSCSRS